MIFYLKRPSDGLYMKSIDYYTNAVLACNCKSRREALKFRTQEEAERVRKLLMGYEIELSKKARERKEV